MELWKQITEFPQYEISSLGRLRSNRTKTTKIVTGTITPLGYVAFILRRPNVSKPYRIMGHRLVALHFIPNPNEYTDVCHNDGNPSNNTVENLRWDTHFNNQMDMRKHGTMQDGEKCITAKLTMADVLAIKNAIANGPRGTSRRICEAYNISPAQISRIKNGHRWKSLT